MMNVYYNLTFFEFLLIFFERMGLFISGNLSLAELATDEIQILVLMGLSISCGIVGTFLILRRMTMLANSLSHTILMGIVIAYVFSYDSSNNKGKVDLFVETLLIASLIVGFLTAFLTEFLTKVGRLQEDASTGLIFTSLFALGIILVTLFTKNSHIGIEAVMGNVDALNRSDLFWIVSIVILNILLCFLFYHHYLITTFDPALATALGISPVVFGYLLMAQVSLTTITAFKAVGVLLVLAFITGPALIARLVTHHLKILIILASFVGCLCSLIGVALTRHLLTEYGMALSTSGIVVTLLLLAYIFVAFFIVFERIYRGWRLKRIKN